MIEIGSPEWWALVASAIVDHEHGLNSLNALEHSAPMGSAREAVRRLYIALWEAGNHRG